MTYTHLQLLVILRMNDPEVKIARWISVIGHPFLLMPVLTGIIAYHILPPHEALIAEIVALGVVIIPAGVYTIVRVRRGTWGDLDVSNQQERRQFYGILLPLLFVLALIALLANVPRSVVLGSFAIIVLVGTGSIINKWIKISLHTAFGVFVAFTLYLIHPRTAAIAFVLACLVAWSRVVLKRHTTGEVVLGALLGSAVGGGFVASLYYLT